MAHAMHSCGNWDLGADTRSSDDKQAYSDWLSWTERSLRSVSLRLFCSWCTFGFLALTRLTVLSNMCFGRGHRSRGCFLSPFAALASRYPRPFLSLVLSLSLLPFDDAHLDSRCVLCSPSSPYLYWTRE